MNSTNETSKCSPTVSKSQVGGNARTVRNCLNHRNRYILRFAGDSRGPIGAKARATDGLGHHRERAENQVEEQAVSTAIMDLNEYTLIQLHYQTGPRSWKARGQAEALQFPRGRGHSGELYPR